MNTIEPDELSNTRVIHDKNGKYWKDFQEIERKRSEWFTNILDEQGLTFDQERKLDTWNNLDFWGYGYIGNFKVPKWLYKFLYNRKLIKQ